MWAFVWHRVDRTKAAAAGRQFNRSCRQMESPAALPVRRGVEEVHEFKKGLDRKNTIRSNWTDAFIISSLIK